MRVWSLSQFLQLKTTKGIVNCSYWKWCYFSASYPPHVTFTGESNCSLVLYVNVKAWWRQTSWELYVCSPRKKSVNLKSSLLDRLRTTNVEHTYMYLTNNIYIYIHICIQLFENINCQGNDKNMLLHVAKVYWSNSTNINSLFNCNSEK